MPKICTRILECKRQYVKANEDFPVMDWSNYVQLIKDTIDALVNEAFLRKATKYLHNGSEVSLYEYYDQNCACAHRCHNSQYGDRF